MAIKELKLIQAKDKDVMNLQDNVKLYLKDLPATLLDGIILESVSLASGSINEISHRLGRKFIGWIVLDQDGSAIIWRDPAATSDPTKFIPLRSSAAVNAKLWVF